MNVRELIESLKQYDPEAPVHIAVPSGNYWNQIKAPEVDHVCEATVKYSEYLSCDELQDEDRDTEPYTDDEGNEIDDPDAKAVIILQF